MPKPGQVTVSLEAIGHNYQLLKTLSGSDVAGVVKANAYGLGAWQVAQQLVQSGCNEFFVATASEGVRLREQGLTQPIYVLEGVTVETQQHLVDAALSPVLNSVQQIDCWLAADASKRLPVAVHVDTGMQRLGLEPHEFLAAAPSLKGLAEIVITHFAQADEEDPESTQAQVARLDSVLRPLRSMFPSARVSMCNSAAALAGGVGDDLVRGGIALYGVNPFQYRPSPLQPVVQVCAPVLQIRTAELNSAVGYGATYVANERMTIATIGVGYADGLPRLLSNNGEVAFRGYRLPIIGRVSMDMIHVDLSRLKAHNISLSEGDMVEVIGANIRIEEIAIQAQTIGYEILTGLNAAQRMECNYINEFLDSAV